MPSDEALRVSLVCTLPLLHFSHSRVAVVQPPAVSKIFNPADDCPLAVPPPRFRLPAYLRRCLARSELPLRTHSSRSFFRGFLRPRLPFWTSSGLWAVLSSDSNRLSFLRQLSLCVRLLFLLRGVLKIRYPSYLRLSLLYLGCYHPHQAPLPASPLSRSTRCRAGVWVYGERRYSLISSSNRVSPTLSSIPYSLRRSASAAISCSF